MICGLSVLLSGRAGRFRFFVLLGVPAAIVLLIHAWWLPRKGTRLTTSSRNLRHRRGESHSAFAPALLPYSNSAPRPASNRDAVAFWIAIISPVSGVAPGPRPK